VQKPAVEGGELAKFGVVATQLVEYDLRFLTIHLQGSVLHGTFY